MKNLIQSLIHCCEQKLEADKIFINDLYEMKKTFLADAYKKPQRGWKANKIKNANEVNIQVKRY